MLFTAACVSLDTKIWSYDLSHILTLLPMARAAPSSCGPAMPGWFRLELTKNVPAISGPKQGRAAHTIHHEPPLVTKLRFCELPPYCIQKQKGGPRWQVRTQDILGNYGYYMAVHLL